MATATELICQLNLLPHPEGGWYRETWRDPSASRGYGTAIYYLLEAGQRSHWHRVDAVEIWHAYAGDGFELQLWDGQNPPRIVHLGPDLARGQLPQCIVAAGEWQAAAPLAGPSGWALAGCTVAPAFEFGGFELAAPDWHPPGTSSASAASRGNGTGIDTLCAGAVAAPTDLPWPPSRHLGRADLSGSWQWQPEPSASVVGEFKLGEATEGLPGHVHGGMLATLCDEAMGWSAWMSGYAAPGARVVVDYVAAARPGENIRLQAQLLRVEGRHLHLQAQIDAQERTLVRAYGRFVAIRPRDWQPFAGWPGLERFTSRR